MATSTDSVYINIIAKTQSAIAGMAEFAAKVGAAYLAMRQLIKSGKEMLNAYIEQEQADRRLAAALKLTGQASDRNFASLKNLASALQQTTIWGDEATQSAAALLLQVGRLNVEGVAKILPLVQDLAATFGMDLNSAAEMVAKSIGGTTNMLSRYGVVIAEGLEGNDKFNAVLAEMEKKFSGMSEELTKTTGGQLQQFNNMIGDLKEIGGEMIAKFLNPAVENLAEFAKGLLNAQEAAASLRKGISELTIAELQREKETIRAEMSRLERGTPHQAFFSTPYYRELQSQLAKLTLRIQSMEALGGGGGAKPGVLPGGGAGGGGDGETYTGFDVLQRWKLDQTRFRILREEEWRLEELQRQIDNMPPILLFRDDDVKILEEIQQMMTEDAKEFVAQMQTFAGYMTQAAQSLGRFIATGDVESFIQAMNSMLASVAIVAAGRAAAEGKWVLMGFWLGVAGVSAFTGGLMSGSAAQSQPDYSQYPIYSGGGKSITIVNNVQGSVVTERQLAVSNAKHMSRW